RAGELFARDRADVSRRVHRLLGLGVRVRVKQTAYGQRDRQQRRPHPLAHRTTSSLSVRVVASTARHPANPYQAIPSPAARSTASSGPRPVQQSANLPSITTAGTDLIPSVFARLATFGSFMSSTLTSQEGQAMLLTRATVSWQAGHLKTSTFRLLAILQSL